MHLKRHLRLNAFLMYFCETDCDGKMLENLNLDFLLPKADHL